MAKPVRACASIRAFDDAAPRLDLPTFSSESSDSSESRPFGMSDQVFEHFHVLLREPLDRRGIEQIGVELHRTGEPFRLSSNPSERSNFDVPVPWSSQAERRPGRAGRPPAMRCSEGRTSPGTAENGWHHAGAERRDKDLQRDLLVLECLEGNLAHAGRGIRARSDSPKGRRGSRAC